MKTYKVTLSSTEVQTVEACYFADSEDMQRSSTGRWVDFFGEPDGPRSTGPVLARFNADTVVSIQRLDTPPVAVGAPA